MSKGAAELVTGEASPVPAKQGRGAKGFLDPVGKGVAQGWARPQGEDGRIDVEILVDGQLVATVTADKHRRGLEQRGIGDGCYGFEWRIEPRWADGQTHQLSARAVGATAELGNSPRTFSLEPGAVPEPARDGGRPLSRGRWSCGRYSSEAIDLARAVFAGEAVDWLDRKSVVKEILRQSPLEKVRENAAELSAALTARRAKGAPAGARPVQLILEAETLENDAIRHTAVQWALQEGATRPQLVTDAPSELSEDAAPELGLAATPRSLWACPQGGLAVFGRPGDVFHPDLSWLVRAAPARFLGAMWDLALQSPGRAVASTTLKRPVTYAPSVLAGDYGPGGFCVRAEALGLATPHDLPLARFAQAAVAAQPAARWLCLPEALSSTQALDTREQTLRLWREQDAGRLGRLGDVAGLLTPLERDPRFVLPVQRAERIAVVYAADEADTGADLLAQLARQEVSGQVSVVCATAGATDRQLARLQGRASELLADDSLKLVECPAGMSLAGRLNLAAEQADAEVVVFIDAHARLTSPFTLEVLAAWSLAEEVAVAASGVSVDAGAGTPGRVRGLAQSDRLDCLAIARSVWMTVGDFDETGFLTLFAMDWALRAEGLGYVTLFSPELAASPQAHDASVSGLEAALLQAVHPAKPSELEARHALEASTAQANARAALLLDRLLEGRRVSRRTMSDLAVEVGAVSSLAEDLRQALAVLGLKLDQIS
jgi:hypothetical protein